MNEIREKNSLANNDKGQLSIFLSVLLIVIFTLIAFIVNIGLFVKAKINLQNSIDSAAWSGAAVQARQLSNIGYLNWEMRNVFKEWMFKYYVMGQISNPKTHLANAGDWTGSGVDFRLRRFDETGTSTGDRFNLPSTCIHFGSTHNICAVYQVPGLPRFKVAALANVSEYFEAAVDTFAQTKAKNCSDRSNYNFAAAMSYAFSTGTQAMSDVPIVAGNKIGAWIKATELALRMRNLEMITNRPPVDEICQDGCANSLNRLVSDDESFGFPINERPAKAFQAAFKSLGGGKYKNQDGFAGSLRITELRPNAYTPMAGSLSEFLIPKDTGFEYPDGEGPTNKYYVDLIPMLANYATFFTTFASLSGSLDEYGIPDAGDVTTEASCFSSKTAMPVPGYIIGFMKNPQVLTYYAIKGEAKFIGLLNPFIRDGGINLKAYAAAKPYGGRIGPALFKGKGTEPSQWKQLQPRRPSPSGIGISSNYLFGFNPGGISADVKGRPIPESSEFYIGVNEADKANEVIGGTPDGSGAKLKFAVPNLVYTLPAVNTGTQIPTTAFYSSPTVPTTESAGLYDKEQYRAFKQNLVGTESSATMSAQEIEDSLNNVHAPTPYDIANYLVPTFEENGETESKPTLKKIDGDFYALYAPLFGPKLLYNSKETVSSIMRDYVDSLDASVTAYTDALKIAADAIRSAPTTAGSGYADAANSIYEAGGMKPIPVANPAECDNISIAAKFDFFFRGNSAAGPTTCNILPLSEAIGEYLFEISSNATTKDFHIFKFTKKGDLTNSQISTAYVPGENQGASPDGTFQNPLNPNYVPLNMRRNHYSTKFVAMSTLVDQNSGYNGSGSDKIYHEHPTTPASPFSGSPPDDYSNLGIKNMLEGNQLNEFGPDLKF
ncbi:Tad domain-containing protein [Bacteriovorax sp. Seq25_V]|uniref:Tad domain-containing protein n=1 Tax=Bacteriovorax sp. Seq25_V TaxID=1201288 RepID=UPI00038A2425|nr:Tad domain-containing protein [Bacteriovorax sp. Seq25_V]EQC45323.1 putative Flp pilus-assembly TadE/G-like protein [Bacteriovorax sp. Seq25_V]